MKMIAKIYRFELAAERSPSKVRFYANAGSSAYQWLHRITIIIIIIIFIDCHYADDIEPGFSFHFTSA